MTTVGYGDITPINPYEKIFAIIIMVLACGVFSYTMSMMGVVLQQVDEYSTEFKNSMNKVSHHLKS